MSLQLDAPLQKRLDVYVDQSPETSRNKWLQRVVEKLIRLKPRLTTSITSEIDGFLHIMNVLPWERFERLYKHLKAEPLSRKLSKIDLFLALMIEGLYAFEKNYFDQQDNPKVLRLDTQRACQRRFQ